MIRIGFLLLAVLMLGGCSSTIDDSEEEWILAQKEKANDLLAAKDYDGLEKFAADCRAQPSPLGSGLAVINTFYDALTRQTTFEQTAKEYQAMLDALNAWSAARPKSVTAKIALAFTYTHIAWFNRGGGYASTVTRDGWTAFGENLQKAADLLASVDEQHKAYPEWYNAMNSVGQGLGEDRDAYLARNKEGTTLFPTATEIYGGPVIYLLPRWGGSNDAVADYITKSADQLGGEEGDMLYARLATKVYEYSFDINPFTEMGLSWRRVQRGMEVICRRFPHSKNMANAYCSMACVAGDQDTARRLFDKLGDREYFKPAWGNRDQFDDSRRWANLPRPPGQEQIAGKNGDVAPDGN